MPNLHGHVLAAAIAIAIVPALAQTAREVRGPAAVVPLASEPPATLIVDPPLAASLSQGRVVIQYRTENLRIVPVFGPAALAVSPRIGHVHVTVDAAPWRWADSSGEPLIINGLPAGPHTVLIELENANHQTLDRKTVTFVIPSAATAGSASPIFGVTIPDGYRHWELVAASHETDPLNELRAILGNPIAITAYRDGVQPFPDGTVLAKIAWKHVQSTEFAAALIPGAATTVQIMVKDAKRYADTGGWGFGRFIDGIAVDEAQHQTCFACHQAMVKDHDYVFTRFAP